MTKSKQNDYKNFAAVEVELLKQEIEILKQEKLLEREKVLKEVAAKLTKRNRTSGLIRAF